MDKKAVLKKSREENAGQLDEREKAVYTMASTTAKLVGGLMCCILIILGHLVLRIPEITYAGWIVFCAMNASSYFVIFQQLKKRKDLFFAILYSIATTGFCIILVLNRAM